MAAALSLREPPRLLALHSEYGYVEEISRSLPREPEAVPEAYQRLLVKQSEAVERARRREGYAESRSIIEREVAVCLALLGGDVIEELRMIERALHRIGQRLAA